MTHQYERTAPACAPALNAAESSGYEIVDLGEHGNLIALLPGLLGFEPGDDNLLVLGLSHGQFVGFGHIAATSATDLQALWPLIEADISAHAETAVVITYRQPQAGLPLAQTLSACADMPLRVVCVHEGHCWVLRAPGPACAGPDESRHQHRGDGTL